VEQDLLFNKPEQLCG